MTVDPHHPEPAQSQSGPAGEPGGAPPTRLWYNRDYLAWLAADTTALAGTVVVSFLLPLIALMYLDDPAAAGLIGAAGTLARVVGIIPSGVLADRCDRKRLMVLGGVLGVLPLGVLMVMHGAGRMEFWMLMGVAVLVGLRSGVFGAVPNTALKSVVGTGHLPTALSANQGRDGAIQLGAAPAGGALLAIGVAPALLAPMAAFALAAIAPLGIRRDLRPARSELNAAGEKASVVLSEALAGIRWIWSRSTLRAAIFVAPLINLAVNAALMTLVFSFQQDGVGPATIGLLTSALGAAMIIGALIAPILVRRVASGVLIFTGTGIAVLGMCVLPLLDNVAAIIAVFGAAFLGVPTLNAALMGYFMAVTPDELMGRALAGFEVLGVAIVPLAPVIAGFGLVAIGTTGTLLIAAALATGSLVGVLAVRGLRTLPRPDRWESHPG